MEVAYTTTLDDYVAFSMHMFRKSKVARSSFLVGWLVIPSACLAAAATIVLAKGPGALAVSCGGGAALYAGVYPPCYRWWIASYVRGYARELGARGVIGPIRLLLTDESLVEITELTRTEAKWRGMVGIEEVGDYTFILVTGMSAAIIPRRGFERQDDYFRVRDFAQARISNRT